MLAVAAPVRWVAVAGTRHRKSEGRRVAGASRRRVPRARASSCSHDPALREHRECRRSDAPEVGPSPRGPGTETGAWRRVLGTAVVAAAFSAGARAPEAFAAPATSSPVSPAPSSSADPSSAGSAASLLARAPAPSRVSARSARALETANPALAELGFLPALALPRTGWFVGSWIAGNATFFQQQFDLARAKFLANWVAYAFIPVVAGILNWLTNALAVKMIFSPEEYVGLDIKRFPETPAGFFGWQGIVPCKVRKMSSTMVDLMTSRLLDVREVFGRLDKQTCGECLEPGIDAIAEGVAADLFAASAESSGESSENEEKPLPSWSAALVAAAPLAATLAAKDLARKHGKQLVASVLGEMQQRVPEVWDVKTQVVGAMTRDKKIIVELFQRCGRNEFAFIRRSGLYFGFLFGIFQMVQWLVWDPWWSLAVGGAAVGYATNWLALTLMFSPVHPKTFGPFTLHGAFLRRQDEVSGEFASMLRSRVLSAENIWREILTGTTTSRVFLEILERKTREQLEKARAEERIVACAAKALGETRWALIERAVVARVLADLPGHLPLVYAYSDGALDLEATLREKMRGLSGEEFEGVLHPVFQEDELTLILVGALLGLVAGFAQAAAF
jgi:uncharacterized membrane protein YheB (UPF0754 family)